MDIAGLILGGMPSAYYLHMSLFLALATLFPENRVMLMYIIPLKMKYLAWAYLLLLVADIVQGHFFSLFALLNYFLFFGWDWINVLPDGLQRRLRKLGHRNTTAPNPDWAKAYKRTKAQPKAASRVVDAPSYRHKCAVCGRTDVSDPDLEFRYCSRCAGYYCYCEDHINDHVHIT